MIRIEVINRDGLEWAARNRLDGPAHGMKTAFPDGSVTGVAYFLESESEPEAVAILVGANAPQRHLIMLINGIQLRQRQAAEGGEP